MKTTQEDMFNHWKNLGAKISNFSAYFQNEGVFENFSNADAAQFNAELEVFKEKLEKLSTASVVFVDKARVKNE